MLIITVEGGLVSSVTTDDKVLQELLNIDRVAVLDYDTDGADENELITVRTRHSTDRLPYRYMACGRVEPVGDTDIDTEELAKEFDEVRV